MTRRPAARRAVAAALLGVAACRAPEHADAVPSLRIVIALEGARVECAEVAELRGDLSARRPELVLFAESFGDEPDPSAAAEDWIEGLELVDPEASPARRIVRGELAPDGALLVPANAGGIHRHVAIAPREGLVVSADVRALAEGDPRPELRALALREIPAAGDARAALVESRRSRARERGASTAEARVLAAGGTEWQTLTLHLPADPERAAVRLSIVGGRGVLVRDVSLRSATPCEEIGATRAARDPHPLVADVASGKERMRSLLLPAGARVELPVEVSTIDPRLDLAFARHEAARGHAGALLVTVDGGIVFRGEAGDSGFEVATIPLAEFAGRRVALELSATGDEGAVIAVGDPCLLSGSTPRPGPNVLLISIDTLRRDALSCLGGGAATEAIDSLAAEGALFASATAPSSFTLPSHASMLGGQHPLAHGATDASRPVDPVRTPLLAAQLAAAGWQTAAFTGGVFLDPDYGLAEGFAVHSVGEPGGVARMFQAEGAALADDGRRFAALAPALEWLARRGDQPFFLFVHTYFVHNYVPSDDFAALHGARRRPELTSEPGGLAERCLDLMKDGESGPELRRLYDAGVDEVDARLVRPLLAELARLGLDDDTVVVLTSDHGEEFQEHGGLFHGRNVYRESIEIPLIARGPGVPRGERREDPARLEDLAPTLAALAGIAPHPSWTGRDLFGGDADGRGERAEPEPRLLHLANRDRFGEYRWDGVIAGTRTLLREAPAGGEPRILLYDADGDPLQQRDRAAESPEALAALARLLDARIESELRAALALPADPSSPADPSAAIRRRLEELGYGVK